MADKDSWCEKLTKIHFWCTVCGSLLFLLFPPAAIACFAPGAGSLYMSLIYLFLEGSGSCGLWFVCFFIFYLVSYMIPAIRQQYIPFLILVLADTAFCCFAAILELVRGNTYDIVRILPDAAISIAYSVTYFLAVKAYRRELPTDGWAEADP